MPMYLLLSLAGFDSITKAQTIDYQWCFNPPPAGRITSSAIDNRIGGCTEIIENGRATREYLVKAFRSRGTAYILYKGKSSSEYYYRGIQDYDQAIRLDPNNSNDFNTRGLGYAAIEQFEQAIQDYSEAIRLDPKNTNSLNNRGLIYTHTGQFDRAIQDYNEAIRLDPNLASAYYNRGITNVVDGDTDIAKAKQLDQNVASAPESASLASLINWTVSLYILVYLLLKLSGISSLYNWYFRRRFVNHSNFRRWRQRPFSSRFSSQEAIAQHALALDTENLFWSLKLSEHTAKAKDIITAELHRRGLSDDEISTWMPRDVQLTSICHAVAPTTSAEYRKLVNRRIILFAVYRLLVAILICFCVIDAVSTTSEKMLEFNFPSSGNAYLTLILAIWAIIMVLFSVMAVIATRKRSLRILLLRPFGEPHLTRALRKVVVKYLGPIATTYTLSDRAYEPGAFIVIVERIGEAWRPALGALFRPSRLLLTVRNERTFLDLARSLCHVTGVSRKTFVVGDQALRIKATQNSWQLAIDMLMHSVELIVMDLSDVGLGAIWEISQLSRQKLLEKCIFICQENHEQRGLSALQQINLDVDMQRVHIYTAKGRFEASSKFEYEMNGLLDRALRRRQSITTPTNPSRGDMKVASSASGIRSPVHQNCGS